MNTEDPINRPTPPADASDTHDFTPEDFDFTEERRPRHAERRRPQSAWIGGAVLILIGIFFLLQNFTPFNLNNWWALFILIPAFTSLAGAWSAFQVDGRFSRRVASSLVGVIFFTGLCLVFLLNLDFGQIWPFALIAGGLMLLASALLPD